MNEYFEWDEEKNKKNQEKHGVSFEEAKRAFLDVNRLIDIDDVHSINEKRYHCYGMVEGCVLTVRFTYRGDKARIFGAAYWRKGVKIYEKRNNL
jgi:hypothetical protein